MSFKRRVLSALGKDVLLEIGRGLKLDGAVARELRADKRARKFLKPVAVASHLLRGQLDDAQAALDAAVTDAYSMPPDQDPTEFLLELNQLVAEDEEQGRKVRGPGLPAHFDPKDSRWLSTDCIEPPSVGS
jgi:hypothetical protein